MKKAPLNPEIITEIVSAYREIQRAEMKANDIEDESYHRHLWVPCSWKSGVGADGLTLNTVYEIMCQRCSEVKEI